MLYQESNITDKKGAKFHLKEWLPETKIKAQVFLLHGLSDHGGRFRHVAEAMATNGIAFIAPDLRGNGLSDGKRGHFDSYEQVMDDIDFLFRQSTGMRPGIQSFIYGQSMGGNLALNYGIRFKPDVAGIISSGPWLRLSKPPAAFVRKIAKGLSQIVPSFDISNGINADDLCHDKAISDAYRADPLIHGRITLNTFQVITESGEWAIKNAGQLSAPLLLMHGTADNITSIEASRQFALNLKNDHIFETWQGMYHELHNEPERDKVIRFILDWIGPRLNQ